MMKYDVVQYTSNGTKVMIDHKLKMYHAIDVAERTIGNGTPVYIVEHGTDTVVRMFE